MRYNRSFLYRTKIVYRSVSLIVGSKMFRIIPIVCRQSVFFVSNDRERLLSQSKPRPSLRLLPTSIDNLPPRYSWLLYSTRHMVEFRYSCRHDCCFIAFINSDGFIALYFPLTLVSRQSTIVFSNSESMHSCDRK